MFRKIVQKRWFYVLYLAVIILVGLEVILRIYNPFHFRVKGNQIVLDTRKKYVFENNTIPVLDKKISWSKNSLGFRGPEKPADKNKRLTIFTVGGSTTECQYLSDGHTWSDKLDSALKGGFNTWLNNAGLSGHSTFGHLVLLKDYLIKLKPDVILFLIGCNDIERDDVTDSDASNMVNSYTNVFTFLSKHSEVCNVAANLVRSRNAYSKHLVDSYFDLANRKNDTFSIPGADIQKRLRTQDKYLVAYRRRVQQLVTMCRENNITPVLITQPSLFGPGIDSISGADLNLFRIDDHTNGGLWWQCLELYNDVVRQVAKEEGLLLIDLAIEMPKSSAYFYDMVHFTDAGTDTVSALLQKHLSPWMQRTFSQYTRK
jgi:lysophospholipase L1-like esterase